MLSKDLSNKIPTLEEQIAIVKGSGLFNPKLLREQENSPKLSDNELLASYLTKQDYFNLKPTLFFDPQFYIREIGKEALQGINPFVHFLYRGGLDGYSPHPLFNALYYLHSYSDVRRDGVNPLVHYATWGSYEGRVPHPLFDVNFYRTSYLDDGARINPLEHYVLFGSAKQLLPFKEFDYELYDTIVGKKRIKQEEMFADLCSHYEERDRQEFISILIQKTLSGKNSIPSLARPVQNLKPICDVVIPVKDAVQWVARSVQAVLASEHQECIHSITLVDDGSSELSRTHLEKIAATSPKITLVSNPNAHGFGSTCNYGALLTSSPYILFLNSDCLVSPRTIKKLLNAFQENSSIGLACPPCNNAANISIPLPVGASFIEVDNTVESLCLKPSEMYPEICTIVGHCLMVSRECFNAADGFDLAWGLGYGEESDLHLRARAQGYRGVLVSNTYVYHFGGGTFRSEATRGELQEKNFNRFINLWGEGFRTFRRLVLEDLPIFRLQRSINRTISQIKHRPCDVLFILPGLTRGVGGIQVVIDLCNHLIMSGIEARAVILGRLDRGVLAEYPEPFYFSPYHAINEKELLYNCPVAPRVVIATLFATTPAGFKLAMKTKATLVNFVQGYEFYFENGKNYEHVRDSYHMAECSIATSEWLYKGIKRHVPGQYAVQLPLGVDPFLFCTDRSHITLMSSDTVRVAMVIRDAPDKGQFILRDLIDLLQVHQSKISLSIFVPHDYDFSSPWKLRESTEIIRLPVDRTVIARTLQNVDIFVDASLHEGYGLFPLEAMACGACVVASESGGISQFVTHDESGILIKEVNKPEMYLHAILKLINDQALRLKIRKNALQAMQHYNEHTCFDNYVHFLKELLFKRLEVQSA